MVKAFSCLALVKCLLGKQPAVAISLTLGTAIAPDFPPIGTELAGSADRAVAIATRAVHARAMRGARTVFEPFLPILSSMFLCTLEGSIWL